MKKSLWVLGFITLHAVAQQTEIPLQYGEATLAIQEKISSELTEKLQAASNPEDIEVVSNLLVEILRNNKQASLDALSKDCVTITKKEKECSCYVEKHAQTYDKNLAHIEKGARDGISEDYAKEAITLDSEDLENFKQCGFFEDLAK